MLCTDKKRKFEILVENISNCNLCSRMCGRNKVFSKKNGDINSKVLFIGEAPGRLGADRTGIPFHGDQAGRNFERLLQFTGLTRQHKCSAM
jgi:uracil-DNA glycosylase family 4